MKNQDAETAAAASASATETETKLSATEMLWQVVKVIGQDARNSCEAVAHFAAAGNVEQARVQYQLLIERVEKGGALLRAIADQAVK